MEDKQFIKVTPERKTIQELYKLEGYSLFLSIQEFDHA